jgi:ketosteroid isomerase-like protein
MTARDTLKAYEDRINHHDFDELTDLIASDAVFWFSDGSYRGTAAIRTAFERTWRVLADERYWLDDLEWIAEAEAAAACLYQFNWEATIDGQRQSGAGRGTTVLSRNSGRWLIVHEHLSGLPG